MEVDDSGLVSVELKNGERCGGLWVRSEDDEDVYCPACVPKMAEFPPMRRPRVMVVAVNRSMRLKAAWRS